MLAFLKVSSKTKLRNNPVKTKFFLWDVEEPTFLIILSRKKEMRQNRKRNRKNLWRHYWPTVDTIPQLSSLQVQTYSYLLYDYMYTKGLNFIHFTYNVSFIDKNLIVRINKLTGKQKIILKKSKPWNICILFEKI